MGLSGRERPDTQGALRAPCVLPFTHSCPPLKLHAVAPGGPPEGECEKENRLLGESQPVAAGCACGTTIVTSTPSALHLATSEPSAALSARISGVPADFPTLT